MLSNLRAGLFVVVAVLVVGGVVFGYPIASYATKETVHDVTINDKERIVKAEDSYYLVFTDKGVYSNKDSFVQFKFDSSDVQNEMKVGSVCTLTVNMFRVPFLSMYENVLEANCKEVQ